MLTLVTSNAAKYAPFAAELERMRLRFEPPPQELPELQTLSFQEALAAKAQTAAALFGRPVLVDDAGLVLEAYAPFPGPLTSTVLQSLGVAGLRRLLNGTSVRARMECHLGCWLEQPKGNGPAPAQPSAEAQRGRGSCGSLRFWSAAVPGQLDFSRSPRDGRMLLSDLFIPDAAPTNSPLQHRARALSALERDLFELHLDVNAALGSGQTVCASRPAYECPFCIEFENDGLSIFAGMMGDRLASRIVYEDEHFIVMPPLGEFIEGGLLLLSREHILSFAHLRPELFEHLERLLSAIHRVLVRHWGVVPLVFEHGPAPESSKGVCCVDHAHLNIFPAAVQIHPHLERRMNQDIQSLAQLARLRWADGGYLFVQENDGARRAYDGHDVPTQLVRRIITAAIGRPERWHWRDYPGQDELLATCQALKGEIRL